MKISFEQIEEFYDFCVIGAGPAGIILALELSKLKSTQSVLLIDFGKDDGEIRNSLDDTIKIVNSQNHHDPYECTNKGLGGSSATWGGRCVMYDEVDFIPRNIIEDNCTWDVNIFEDIKPYIKKTSEYFECGDGPFDTKESSTFRNIRIAENFKNGDITDSRVERWSMPTRFGLRYEAELQKTSNLYYALGVEARNFSQIEKSGTVSELLVRDVKTAEERKIKAGQFVIATGTQETTRLLLRNKRELFSNLEEAPRALGVYYQGHVSGKIASVRFYGDPKKTEYGFLTEPDGTYIRQRFQLSTEAICRENLLNTALWLDNPLYFDPKHKSGAMSFMYLAMIMPVLGKRLAPPAIAHSVTKGKVVGIPQHIWNIIRGMPGSLWIPAKTFYGRYCVKRKLPGVFLYSPNNKYALHFHAEQIPHESNRMELDRDGETLIIRYGLMEADIESVIRTHDVLDKYLRETQCGELEYWFEPKELASAIRQMSVDGIHQSGTTRIADDPDKGVVNRDLKVWGTNNIYVCSASAFPTSGQANPTYLLGAFAVRLARHLTK